MHLTTDEFADVVTALQGDTAGDGDKRRANRIIHECETLITLGTDPASESEVTVRVKDMSPRGLCLVHTGAFARGSTFVVRLPRPQREPVSILCTVAYARRVKASLYHIGAEFTCVLENKPQQGRLVADAAEQQRIRQSMWT